MLKIYWLFKLSDLFFHFFLFLWIFFFSLLQPQKNPRKGKWRWRTGNCDWMELWQNMYCDKLYMIMLWNYFFMWKEKNVIFALGMSSWLFELSLLSLKCKYISLDGTKLYVHMWLKHIMWERLFWSCRAKRQ